MYGLKPNNPKSGKSTIITSLTGCRISQFEGFIRDKINNNSVFVCCGSPQKSGIKLTKLKEWLQQCNEDIGCTGMIMAIQPSKTQKRVSMEDIFGAAIVQGFDVYAFVVGPGYNDNVNSCYMNVSDRLGKMGVLSCNIFKINGKEFALKNANDINQKTSLIL